MALIKCKECNHDLSDNAPKCLNCGARHTTKSTKIIVWMLFGTIFLITILNASKTSTVKQSNSKIAVAESKPKTAPPRPKLTAEIKKSILKPFLKNYDKMERITWYKNPAEQTEYLSRIYTYMGEKDGGYWMRFVIRYTADTWIFLESVKFLIDGERIDFNFKRSDIKRENSSRAVWESHDAPVEINELALLTMIGNSKDAEMRFVGSKRSVDRKITKSEKRGIKRMVEAYIKLQNK